MADAAIDYAYRYGTASWLDDGTSPTLHLATTDGPAEHPRLFRGRILHPVLFADALLTVGAVARSRFHIPPAMLGRILRLADPVVTASTDRLRFEAFSSCASVYARLDLLPDFVDGTFIGSGTTNVDLGADVRAALAGVTDAARLDLEVGLDDLEVAIDGERHAERRVALPARWVRGFAETQTIMAGMRPRIEVDGAAFRRFLRALPRGAKGPIHVRTRGHDLDIAHRPSDEAIPVGDPERLRVLERLASAIRSVRILSSVDGASTWSAALPDARFTLAVSAEAWRGFSGEGQVLDALSRPRDRRVEARVTAALGWRSDLESAALAQELGVDQVAVDAALARLATAGLVGFDVADGAYFARRLPFAGEPDDRRQPRLRRARALVEAGAIRFERDHVGEGTETVAWVTGSSAEYRVRLSGDDRACTCPWWGKHSGDRGPCAHILAVQLTLESTGLDALPAADDA